MTTTKAFAIGYRQGDIADHNCPFNESAMDLAQAWSEGFVEAIKDWLAGENAELEDMALEMIPTAGSC